MIDKLLTFLIIEMKKTLIVAHRDIILSRLLNLIFLSNSSAIYLTLLHDFEAS